MSVKVIVSSEIKYRASFKKLILWWLIGWLRPKKRSVQFCFIDQIQVHPWFPRVLIPSSARWSRTRGATRRTRWAWWWGARPSTSSTSSTRTTPLSWHSRQGFWAGAGVGIEKVGFIQKRRPRSSLLFGGQNCFQFLAAHSYFAPGRLEE